MKLTKNCMLTVEYMVGWMSSTKVSEGLILLLILRAGGYGRVMVTPVKGKKCETFRIVAPSEKKKPEKNIHG